MKINSLKNLANAHADGVWAVAWAPATQSRGALLITGSVDETVKLWKGDELELERTNTGFFPFFLSPSQLPFFVIHVPGATWGLVSGNESLQVIPQNLPS